VCQDFFGLELSHTSTFTSPAALVQQTSTSPQRLQDMKRHKETQTTCGTAAKPCTTPASSRAFDTEILR
jgi:hypothetical protein